MKREQKLNRAQIKRERRRIVARMDAVCPPAHRAVLVAAAMDREGAEAELAAFLDGGTVAVGGLTDGQLMARLEAFNAALADDDVDGWRRLALVLIRLLDEASRRFGVETPEDTDAMVAAIRSGH